MKPNDHNRVLFLNAVINMQPDYGIAMKALEEYGWDFNGNPLMIQSSVFKEILSGFVEEKIAATDIHIWAEFLELREDVDFFENDEPILSQILYELANPDLEGELTKDRAKSLISQL